MLVAEISNPKSYVRDSFYGDGFTTLVNLNKSCNAEQNLSSLVSNISAMKRQLSHKHIICNVVTIVTRSRRLITHRHKYISEKSFLNKETMLTFLLSKIILWQEPTSLNYCLVCRRQYCISCYI